MTATATFSTLLFDTKSLDGSIRSWGVCEVCGQVDELAAKQRLAWCFTPRCEACQVEADPKPKAPLDVLLGLPAR